MCCPNQTLQHFREFFEFFKFFLKLRGACRFFLFFSLLVMPQHIAYSERYSDDVYEYRVRFLLFFFFFENFFEKKSCLRF
jgi:hypothetical protein